MPAPIGATGMGRQGKKKRFVVHGQSRATPRPPSVSASSSPWETRTATTTGATRRRGFSLMRSATAIPDTIARAIECVAPRCPHVAP